MNLQEQGFRYVLRDNKSLAEGFEARWVHSSDVRPADQDCTDMDDEAFDEALRLWGLAFCISGG